MKSLQHIFHMSTSYFLTLFPHSSKKKEKNSLKYLYSGLLKLSSFMKKNSVKHEMKLKNHSKWTHQTTLTFLIFHFFWLSISSQFRCLYDMQKLIFAIDWIEQSFNTNKPNLLYGYFRENLSGYLILQYWEAS